MPETGCFAQRFCLEEAANSDRCGRPIRGFACGDFDFSSLLFHQWVRISTSPLITAPANSITLFCLSSAQPIRREPQLAVSKHFLFAASRWVASGAYRC